MYGASPTLLRGRAWMDGTAEPTTWDLEAEDATKELQPAAATGLVVYVSGGATTGPIVGTFDDFAVRPLGARP